MGFAFYLQEIFETQEIKNLRARNPKKLRVILINSFVEKETNERARKKRKSRVVIFSRLSAILDFQT